jgi:hypothetical protein
MLISIRGLSVMLSPTGILRYRCCWWRHSFVVQKSFTLFQIMPIGTVDLAPLFYVIGRQKGLLSF